MNIPWPVWRGPGTLMGSGRSARLEAEAAKGVWEAEVGGPHPGGLSAGSSPG